MNFRTKNRNMALWILVALSSIRSATAVDVPDFIKGAINEYVVPIFGQRISSLGAIGLIKGVAAYVFLYVILKICLWDTRGNFVETVKKKFFHFTIVFLIVDILITFVNGVPVLSVLTDFLDYLMAVVTFDWHFSMIPRFTWQVYGTVWFLAFIASKIKKKIQSRSSTGSTSAIDGLKDAYNWIKNKISPGSGGGGSPTGGGSTGSGPTDLEKIDKLIKTNKDFRDFIKGDFTEFINHPNGMLNRIAKDRLNDYVEHYDKSIKNLDEFIGRYER